MTKKIIKLIIVLLILELFTTSLQTAKKALVTINSRPFYLEVAQTPQSQYQGLSHRRNIEADGGMLFIFAKAKIHTFVMRNCLVPIDLIFLDEEKCVINFYEMELEYPHKKRCYYSSHSPAKYAIELKGGSLRQLDIQPGQKVYFFH